MLKYLSFLFACLLPLLSIDGVEQTLIMVKPDAVERNQIGQILSRFEQEGLKMRTLRMARLTKEQAETFYAEHRERPFYPHLVAFITSGPVVACVLEGENAVRRGRALIGATNPREAAPGTIRRDFALSKESNAIHGSDSPEAAEREIRFFFPR